MTKKYDYLVYFGRFQPFTQAHLHMIKEACKRAHHVIIMVGSCGKPRSVRNPWTLSERRIMIEETLMKEGLYEQVTIVGIPDIMYRDHLWVERARSDVDSTIRHRQGDHSLSDLRIGLIGHGKDSSSYYLTMFPTWGSVNIDNYQGINATAARNGYFSNICDEWLHAAEDMLPWPVVQYLIGWKKNPAYAEIMEDRNEIIKINAEFGHGPHLAADNVVFQAGHVLMIRRKNRPGKGLWALPGGFVHADESMAQAAVRELYEETKLDVPKGVIWSYHRDTETFDDPYRDPRSRVVTRAYVFDLDHELQRKVMSRGARGAGEPIPLTKYKASDDAAEAAWVPILSLQRDQIFADHYDIIQMLRDRM